MINLLPPDVKTSLTYARRNNLLIRYMVGMSFGIICVIIVVIGGWLYLQQETNAHKKSIANAEEILKRSDEDKTIARAGEISDSLKLVVEVLSQEVRFSELIPQIGSVMPSGTVLQDLTLDASLSGGIDLEVGAQSHIAGVQAQANLQDPRNRIFEKADIVSSTCQDDPELRYPCAIKMRALFAKDNTFTVTDQQGGGS